MIGKKEKVQRVKEEIEKWQSNDFIHPLTCGNDSQKHRLLVAEVRSGQEMDQINLKCLDCNWVQDIPDILIQISEEE